MIYKTTCIIVMADIIAYIKLKYKLNYFIMPLQASSPPKHGEGEKCITAYSCACLYERVFPHVLCYSCYWLYDCYCTMDFIKTCDLCLEGGPWIRYGIIAQTQTDLPCFHVTTPLCFYKTKCSCPCLIANSNFILCHYYPPPSFHHKQHKLEKC